MIESKTILIAAAAVVTIGAEAYQPAKSPLMTEWGEKVTPENAWREYPRPQMVRTNWTNLNGEWDYAITSVTNTPGRPTKWDGKILVPFAIESALSGVGRLLEPDEFLWYTRKIQVKKSDGGRGRILLHFGAVDFRTMVFIGHNEVTDIPHESGSNPFTLDITDYVSDGENELTVCVWDPTDTFVNNRGKQVRKPGGCHYTRVSGIWQSVWMESVPADYISGYKVVTDIDKGEVRIEVEKRGGGGHRMSISAFDGDRKIGDFTPLSTSTYSLHLQDFECWSPENPKLYAFTAKYGKDEIRGYFGMRKFEKRKDAKGVLRFFLNNKPYYVMATLDQGWWPDGLLTPPSDAAMAFDIRTLKDCGFNAMRKHIKVEPMRYYYLCDTMGILVLQDMPCTRGTHTCPMEPETVKGYGLYRQELKDMMDALQAVPSIVMWVPYNEGWGQCGEFLTHSTLDFVRRHDPTRLVNGPSGCWDWEGGQLMPKGWDWTNRVETAHKPKGACEAADTVDMHLYRGPTMFKVNDRRISFLGEFGGLGHPVEGHVWRATKGNWGYGGIDDTATHEGLEKTYLGLMSNLVALSEHGLGGSVYTQTTDVEIEINGLMTYDRKVLKFDPKVLRKVHSEIISKVNAAAAGESYSVAILGDMHYDVAPESVYHSHYDESNQWAKVQHAEFRFYGEMWRRRGRDLVAASGCIACERPTDFVLQLGDLIQGDCDDVSTHQRMLDDCIGMLRTNYPTGIPFLTVVGNHDVRGKGASQAYFEFSEAYLSRQIGQPVKYPVFSFRRGDDLWVFCDFEVQDLALVNAAIEAMPGARHIFLVSHGPFTPSECGPAEWRLAGRKVCDALRPRLYELLSRRHVIVLSGHTHTTAWFHHENEFGGFTEFTANSVWIAPELATAEPLCEGVAEYGKFVATSKRADKQKVVFKEAAKEFRPGLKGYYMSRGAGHARLNVSETGVTVDYYPGATNVPARTFRMK